MLDLLLHPDTNEALKAITDMPAHALLFSGNESSGKYAAALNLAENILGKDPTLHPYFMSIEAVGKSVTIDQIRELQGFLKLKTTGNETIRRIVIIRDAHNMTEEAQNALLKLLEEPPDDTVIVLTAVDNEKLRPTIYSRVQKIRFKPVSKANVLKFKPQYEDSAITKAYLLSQGDAGLLIALLEQDDNHPLVNAIVTAKKLISSPAFDRIARVDELSKDKETTMHILVALKRIATAGLKQSADKGAKNHTKWKTILSKVLVTESAINTNANLKLLLTDLFLSFS